MSMIVNRRDLDFLIYELLDAEKLFDAERYADYDRASVEAFLDTAQDIAETHFAPCAAKLDADEPVFDGNTVTTAFPVARCGFPAVSRRFQRILCTWCWLKFPAVLLV